MAAKTQIYAPYVNMMNSSLLLGINLGAIMGLSVEDVFGNVVTNVTTINFVRESYVSSPSAHQSNINGDTGWWRFSNTTGTIGESTFEGDSSGTILYALNETASGDLFQGFSTNIHDFATPAVNDNTQSSWFFGVIEDNFTIGLLAAGSTNISLLAGNAPLEITNTGNVVLTGTSADTAADTIALLTATLNADPAAPSAAIWLAGEFNSVWNSTFANTGNSHLPALVGRYLATGTGTNILGIGVEGKVEINSSGNTETGTALQSLIQLDAAGSITNAFGLNAEVINTGGGTIGLYAALFMPDLTSVPGITNKLFGYNQDANAPILSAGKVFGPQGYNTNEAGGELSPDFHPGYITGRYYFGTVRPAGFSAEPLTAGSIYGRAFKVGTRHTFPTIGITITTPQAGSHVRLGVYYTGSGEGIIQIFDSGSLSSAAGGDVTIAFNKTLEIGPYFSVIQTDTNNVGINFITDLLASHTIGSNSSTNDTSIPVITGGSFGALPSTLTWNNFSLVPGQFLAPGIFLIA